MNNTTPPEATAMNRVRDALLNGPPEGMRLPDIATATGVRRELSKYSVYRAWRRVMIFRLHIPGDTLGRSRYFASVEAMDAARALLPEFSVAQPQPKKHKPRGDAARAEVKVNKLPGKRQIDLARKPMFHVAASEAGVQIPDYLPRAAKIVKITYAPNYRHTVAPTPVDPRFHVPDSHVGEFGLEWVKLRGG